LPNMWKCERAMAELYGGWGTCLLMLGHILLTPSLFCWRLAPSDFHMFFKLKSFLKASDLHLMMLSDPRSRNCVRNRTLPSNTRARKISLYIMISAWISLRTMWRNRGLMSNICSFFLFPLTYIHLKKIWKLTFWLIFIYVFTVFLYWWNKVADMMWI
jgi:hypothetical protein